MHERRTTLEGLEVGALAVDRRVDEQVARCLAAAQDPVALRQELGGLQGMKSQRAEFAYCLFSVDLAKLGEPEAKANFARYAGILLEAHRDPDLTAYLLGGNEELQRRWASFVPLLLEFDRVRQAQEAKEPDPAVMQVPPAPEVLAEAADAASRRTEELDVAPLRTTLNITTAEGPADAALDAAIQACFAARGDREKLALAMEALTAFPSSPREEFAHCLFDLELVRLGADDAKPQFAQRVKYLAEAYHDAARAKQLFGQSEHLEALWKDVRPYLEEFFEPAEEVEEVIEEEIAIEEVPPDAGAADEAQEVQLSDLDALEVSALPPPPPAEARAPRKPPPPPMSNTPTPGRIPALTPGKGTVRRVSSITARRLSMPPVPAAPHDDVPSPETLAFWRYAEEKLALLPDENGQLSGKQAFELGSRENRSALKHLASDVVGKFEGSPEARSLACLVELYLAAQLKEKTLFGKPNEKRQLALQDALSLLTANPLAAGHAAVLFENDGPDTIAHFADALEVMHRYLAHCMRTNVDPLSPEAVKSFQG